MISLFDLEKLQTLLQDFYQITSMRITVFDENRNELISYPKQVESYCKIIRGVNDGFEACMACDRAACHAAAKKRRTHIYRCHAGFTEAVTPLYIGEILVGYMFFGHVFSYTSHEEGWKTIEALTRTLRVNQSMLKDAVMGAIYIPEETIRAAAHILQALSSFLIFERMASLKQDTLTVQLDSYLSTHFMEDITVEGLCESLGVGKTLLYKTSHQLYGCGIIQRVRSLRIEHAKKLLLDPTKYSLAEISDQCGFHDYNYFIAVFSKEVGQSPIAYRRSNT